VKVVIATDGSEAALHAAHAAVRLLRDDATVAVVAVVPDREDPLSTAGGIEGPALTEEEADEDFAASVAAGRQAVERTVAEVPGAAQAVVVPSDARTDAALAEIVQQQGADLLVIGSEQPGFFQRLFAGSTTDRIVHHAPCPVLVVPHPG
jgi:nucleotide-binding universal stress UspA family protein